MKTFKTIITEATEAKMRRLNASIERKQGRILQGPSFDEYIALHNSINNLADVYDRLAKRYDERTVNIGDKKTQQEIDKLPRNHQLLVKGEMSTMPPQQLRSYMGDIGELVRQTRRKQGLEHNRYNNRKTNPNVDRLNFRGNEGTSNN